MIRETINLGGGGVGIGERGGQSGARVGGVGKNPLVLESDYANAS